MNYQRIYDEIIERAKSRGLNKKLLEGYFEKHHIIPKCFGGSNDKDNLVLLTSKEHFVCHKILWRIHKDNKKLFFAYQMMAKTPNQYQNRNNLLSAKEYEIIKHSSIRFHKGKNSYWFGKHLSDEHKLKLSIKCSLNSSNRGKKMGPQSVEHKNKISLANKGRTPWNKGKKMEVL